MSRSTRSRGKWKERSKKPSEEMDFMYYPQISDAKFREHIYRKKEFNRSRVPEDYAETADIKELCGLQKSPRPYQEFLRNFISSETPYDGILLFHGVGVGKCLHPETPVYVNGTLKQIEEIWEDYHSPDRILEDAEGALWSKPMATLNIRSLDPDTDQMLTRPVHRLYRQFISEPMRLIELENGASIKITLSHHLLTENGWSTNFKDNRYIAVPKNQVDQDDTSEWNGAELVRIKAVSEEWYHGFVYDLEIPKYHNYVAGGIICHNTCSAVTIAEGLRPYIEAAGKKIYVLTPSQVESNFKNELYSFAEEKVEQEHGLDPGSRQCTGLTYYQPPQRGRKETARQKAITAKWTRGDREVYRFFNVYGTGFPNFVQKQLKDEGIDIGKYFSNSLFIIDEAHNMVTKKGVAAGMGDAEEEETTEDGEPKPRTKRGRGAKGKADDEDKSPSVTQLPIIKEILSKAKNTKVLLLSATPIRDDVQEFIELINILRINDGHSGDGLITADKLFRGQDPYDPRIPIRDRVDADYFARMTKGYISYVRGENPISFPEVRYPEDGWTPRPILDISAGPVLEENQSLNDPSYFIIPIPDSIEQVGAGGEIEKVPLNLGLVQCHMNDQVQYEAHREWVRTDVRGRDLAIQGLQVSTIVYPLKGNRFAWGEKGFNAAFDEDKDAGGTLATTVRGRGRGKSRGKPKQYLWKGADGSMQSLISFLGFPEAGPGYDNPISQTGQIGLFSAKFDQLMRRIKDPGSRGFTFIYCRFVHTGALSVALFLELNGFMRYHHDDESRTRFRRDDLTGRYDTDAAPSPLISYKSLPYDQRVFRCYRCCKLDTDPIHLDRRAVAEAARQSGSTRGRGAGSFPNPSTEAEDPLGEQPHFFEQGSYTLFLDTGKVKRDIAIAKTRAESNKWGRDIKVVIGSKVSGEGVNLFNVRQAHIMNPWHNLTEIHQARGRAIRNCSHVMLPPQFRNVTIYEYCSTVPLYMQDTQLQNGYQYAYRQQQLGDQEVMLYEPINAQGIPESIGRIPENWELFVETNDERLFRRALNKDLVTKYLERLSKINAIDCNLFKPLNVFPTDKDGTRRCDYMKCDYDCAWNPEPGAEEEADWINTDTYNLFFSKVQIDRAIQLVRELFKKYPALKAKDIVSLVRKREPRMEVDYVYQALDTILGDPPGRAPLEIMDKMGRTGYLVYRGNAYIFQPFDVPDPRAPVRYRQKPLQIKERSQDFKVEVSEEEERKVKKVQEADHEAIVESKVLPELLRTYSMDADAPETTVLRSPYIYEDRLDRIPLQQLRILFTRIFTLAEFQDQYFDLFKGMFIEYLAKRFLLLLRTGRPREASPYGWLDRMGRSSLKRDVANPNDFDSENQWRVVGHRIGTPIMVLDNKNNLGPVRDMPSIILELNNMESVAQNHPLSKKVYGFYDPTITGKDGFKVSFTAQEKITYNADGTPSQRSLARGKSIDTYLKPDLLLIFQTIRDLLMNEMGDFTYEGWTAERATKQDLILDIERGLRILDFLVGENYAASGGRKSGERVKYLLYPFQDKYVPLQKVKGSVTGLSKTIRPEDGCRKFTDKGHFSNLDRAKAYFHLDDCEPR